MLHSSILSGVLQPTWYPQLSSNAFVEQRLERLLSTIRTCSVRPLTGRPPGVLVCADAAGASVRAMMVRFALQT